MTYAVTMSELGEEIVHKYQGREPSGRNINEIVLDLNSKLVVLSKLSFFKYLGNIIAIFF